MIGLIALIGPSAAGKSTYASRWPVSWRLNLDTYREMAADDAGDQSATRPAAQMQSILLDTRLARGLTTIVDNTNLQRHVRAELLARARYWQTTTTAILITAPLATCITRNAARSRQVPVDVLRQQHQHIPTERQLHVEGWGSVQVHTPDAAPAPA